VSRFYLQTSGRRFTYRLVVVGITYGLVVVGITYGLVVVDITYVVHVCLDISP